MADTVREMGAKCRNWSRWGPTDELGTLNYIAPETIVRATRAVRRGVTFSLAIPFDNTGPQINQPRRFNPIHRMILTGPDFTTGDRKSTRLNSSHGYISYAVFCLKKKKTNATQVTLTIH